MPIRIKPLAPSSQYAAFAGYEHGAPLSDIGEEETIASITPKSRAVHISRSPSPAEHLTPSPAPVSNQHNESIQRRNSIGATSDGSDDVDWETFDTSTMMSGRLAADVAKEQEREALDSKRNSMISGMDVDEMAVLNDRAEQILQDARTRLTHMEDNLTKARHSVLWSPRSSPNIAEYHQPAGSLYRSISLAGAGRRISRPSKDTSPVHARGSSDTTPTGLKRLSMVAEARSSSAQEYSRSSESPQSYSRMSPSTRLQAQSPSSVQSVQSPLRTLEEEEDSSDPSTSKTSPENRTPKGLGIDTMSKEPGSDPPRSVRTPTLMRSASAASLGRPESAASTRSIRESMTDLRLRIHDIKVKAQADKDRRQNVQSRNTPSPFTQANPEKWYTSAPEYQQGGSPVNANAGQGWSPTHVRSTSLDAQVTPRIPKSSDFLQPETPLTAIPLAVSPAGRTDVNTPNLARMASKPDGEVRDSVIDQSQYEDAAQDLDEEDQVAASQEEQVYLNEVLEESLHDVEPDVPDIPEHLLSEANAERHEDRLDAFDYENMFLHSAMGNYRNSQTTDSDTSDTESVETSRADQMTPTANHDNHVEKHQIDDEDQDEEAEEDSDSPETNDDDDEATQLPEPDDMPTPTALTAPVQPWMRPMRTNSVESVSTEASFATAREGDQGDVASDDEEDEIPSEIFGWGNNTTAFPTPPIVSPRREHLPEHVFPTPPTSARLASPTKVHNAHHDLSIITGEEHQSNGMPTPTRSPISAKSATSRTPTFQKTQHSRQPSKAHSRAASLNHPLNEPNSTRPSESHPANTEILMESLIKLADPDFTVGPPPSRSGQSRSRGDSNGSIVVEPRNGTFADIDKDLVLALLREVGQVCSGVLKAEKRRDGREVKELRRRLDEARGLLEGGSQRCVDNRRD